jgi:hypothetical protein
MMFKSLSQQQNLAEATLPISLDHNRIIISLEVYLLDGRVKQVRDWADNGSPFWLTKRKKIQIFRRLYFMPWILVHSSGLMLTSA